MHNEKEQLGFSTMTVLIIVLVVALALGFYYVTSEGSSENMPKSMENTVTTSPQMNESDTDYVIYTEPANTPAELNNESLNELDALMKDVDQNSNEDLTDLQ